MISYSLAGIWIKLVKESQQPVAEVARQLGIPKSTLHDWVTQQTRESEETEGKQSRSKGEVLRLKRELERVKKERDFLKKATAFFARESK